MTPPEYIQLKAFARIDGAMLSLLWTAAFVCMVVGMAQPGYTLAALLLIAATPFFVGRRLKRFRDEDRGGSISLMRGWAYAVLMFFYAGLLLAMVHYIYFAFIDQGYLMLSLKQTLASPEGKLMVERYGIGESMAESMAAIEQMRPIDYALNVLSMNISLGIVLGLPIAAIIRRKKV